MRVGIRELKLRFKHYLGCARNGELVVITDHGNPVARLEPIEGYAEAPESLKHLVEEDRLIYKPPPRNLPPPIKMLPGEETAVDYVLEQRR